jgi:hypothetical protein
MLVELLAPADGRETGAIIDVRDAYGTALVRANKARYVTAEPGKPEEVMAAEIAAERAGIATAQVDAMLEQIENLNTALLAAQDGKVNAVKVAAEAKIKCDQFLQRQEAEAKARLADNAVEVAEAAKQAAAEASAVVTEAVAEE